MSAKQPVYRGQALIEGVRMQGQNGEAFALRNEDGDILYKILDRQPARTGLPLLRGIGRFFVTLGKGFANLCWSARYAGESEDERFSGFSALLSIVGAIITAIVLFGFLPALAAALLKPLWGYFWATMLEGGLRVLLFVLYLLLIRHYNDIKRLLAYQGAANKTLHAYAANAELSEANVRRFPLLHMQCGSGFVLTSLLLAMLVLPFCNELALWPRIFWKLGLFLLILALNGELHRLGERYANSSLMHFLLSPSLLMQRMLTKEPDPGQIEVAINSLKAVPGFAGESITDAERNRRSAERLSQAAELLDETIIFSDSELAAAQQQLEADSEATAEAADEAADEAAALPDSDEVMADLAAEEDEAAAEPVAERDDSDAAADDLAAEADRAAIEENATAPRPSLAATLALVARFLGEKCRYAATRIAATMGPLLLRAGKACRSAARHTGKALASALRSFGHTLQTRTGPWILATASRLGRFAQQTAATAQQQVQAAKQRRLAAAEAAANEDIPTADQADPALEMAEPVTAEADIPSAEDAPEADLPAEIDTAAEAAAQDAAPTADAEAAEAVPELSARHSQEAEDPPIRIEDGIEATILARVMAADQPAAEPEAAEPEAAEHDATVEAEQALPDSDAAAEEAAVHKTAAAAEQAAEPKTDRPDSGEAAVEAKQQAPNNRPKNTANKGSGNKNSNQKGTANKGGNQQSGGNKGGSKNSGNAKGGNKAAGSKTNSNAAQGGQKSGNSSQKNNKGSTAGKNNANKNSSNKHPANKGSNHKGGGSKNSGSTKGSNTAPADNKAPHNETNK